MVLVSSGCRAGARKVYAVERSARTTDLAAACLALSSSLNCAEVLCCDPRELPGTGRVGRAADVLILEGFDSGLLGEGVLHTLAICQASNLLAPNATVMPCSAQVFCAPIELSCSASQLQQGHEQEGSEVTPPLCQFDLKPLAGWEWCPDYVGLDLGAPPCSCGWRHSPAGTWRLLADPQPAFSFDFTDVLHKHMQPTQHAVTFTAKTAGQVNAIAFWFQLHLTPEEAEAASAAGQPCPPMVLDTSPLAPRPRQTTWQVAVQRLGLASAHVSPGQELRIQASHDTYSISFAGPSTEERHDGGEHSGAQQPVKQGPFLAGDPTLVAARTRAQPLCAAFAKALAQDPVAARTAAALGMQLAAQAGLMRSAMDGGSTESVDSAAAADFAVMLCSH